MIWPFKRRQQQPEPQPEPTAPNPAPVEQAPATDEFSDDDFFEYDDLGRRRLKTAAELGLAGGDPPGGNVWESPRSWAEVRGTHYTGWVETIKQMKRDGLHDDALELLAECQEATIKTDKGDPAPWYFEQAAIVLRKEGRLLEERDVLLRYAEACNGQPGKKLGDRLEKVNALIAASPTVKEG